MKLIKQSLYLLGMLFVLASCSKDESVSIEETANLESTFETAHDQEFAQEVLDLLNEHRSTLGLTDLEWHTASKDQAINHSVYMVEKNKLSHDNFFNRSDYLKSKGAKIVSENVAYGQRTPEAVVAAWLASPDHKEAIEKDYTHTGIGVVQNKYGINYYTQIFIK